MIARHQFLGGVRPAVTAVARLGEQPPEAEISPGETVQFKIVDGQPVGIRRVHQMRPRGAKA